MSQPKHITLVFPSVAPGRDGIGDHTLHLAAELAKTTLVSVVTRQRGQSRTHPLETAIRRTLPAEPEPLHDGFVAAVMEERSDWLLIPYNPFSWGPRGFALWLPRAVHTLKRELPALRVGLIAHETFVRFAPVKPAVMTSYQRWQLWRLGCQSDAVFFSIEPWVTKFRRWFPHVPVAHLPAGSNIDEVAADKDLARSRLGAGRNDLVLGVFGTAHPSRSFGHIRAAHDRLASAGLHPKLVYIGPEGKEVARELSGIGFIDLGRLPSEEVSKQFPAMDIYFAPFTDGVSARRGSFLSGIQHGVATLTTLGHLTDPTLSEAAGHAFIATPVRSLEAYAAEALRLALEPELRTRVGAGGKRLFNARYSWPVIADSLLAVLREAERRR